ncbi:MAG: penicillin-binding protein [Mycobacteriaceae bacterium]|nr:penicillin-binding protein [Mycobacteriaceae bacterium]
MTVKVPNPSDIKTNQVATIVAEDGSTVLSRIVPPGGNRTDVTIEQVPPAVRNAVIAAEDRSFYTNPGFSVTGILRAVRDNVLGRDNAGGGSTITQQYVKNAMLTSDRKLSRKVKEFVISAKMAREWSKDDILVAYLNTIYFGRNAYGIAAAAKAYFDKPVDKLTVAEGAVLASTIRSPSNLDPEQNPDSAKQRWGYVLDGMVDGGKLSREERQSVQYPQVISRAKASGDAADQGPAGLIKSQVIRELVDAGISEQQINTEGLQITTTIDPKAQKAAEESVVKVMDGEPQQLRTAVVSVDPKSGAIRAYYGGPHGTGFDYANAGEMTGSSFKVFGLAANLQQGKPLSQMYDSSPLTVHGIEITNVEGEGCGVCTIAEALKRSLNTSFYRMELEMQNGPEKIAEMAHSLGIPKAIPGIGKTLVNPDGSPPNTGIILGQYQVRVMDMASAYATLAASGVYHAPHFVSKVVTSDGSVLLDRTDPAGESRVDSSVADNVTAAMEPIAGWSRHHDLKGGRPSAVKTGTVQLGTSKENRDAWMVGYTPSLSTAVWVGTDNGEKLRNSSGGMVYGSGLPGDIWKGTMDGALAGSPIEKFPKPPPIGGQAGVPAWSAPYTPPSTTEEVPFELPQMTQSFITPLPGVTIPVQVPALPQEPRPRRQAAPQAQGSPMPGQPMLGDPNLPTTTPSGPPTTSESPPN